MSIWRILGFGTNHKAIEEHQEILAKRHQKAIEAQNVQIRLIVRHINREGIEKVLKNPDFTIEEIKVVLKHFKNDPPIKSTDWKKNWPEAQQWLYEQEHPEVSQTQEELKEMKKKMQEMEAKLAEYERNK